MSDAGDELGELLDDVISDSALAVRVRATATAMPPPIVAHLPFLAAANKLRASLLGLVDQLITSQDMGVLLTGSAGVGKTESMLAAAEAMLDREQLVVWAAPTIDMAHETDDRASGLGIQGIVLHGRNATTCNFMDKILVSRAEGYAPGEYVCPGCKMHPDNLAGQMMELNTCEHYRRLSSARRAVKQARSTKTRLPLIITTYENAVAGLKHAKTSRQGDVWNTKQVFFDEDPSRAMRKRATLSDADLTRTPKDRAASDFLRILSMARAIAADERMAAIARLCDPTVKAPLHRAIHKPEESYFAGSDLHDLLYSAADALKLKLVECLATAISWTPKVGKGEMFYADRGLLQYIVNANLPTFAQRLHDEINRRHTGISGTYSVRLECKSKDSAWRFELDFLEPFRNGQDNVIIGDAYADREFVEAMFGGRPMFPIEVRIALPDNVRVFRSQSAKTTKRILRVNELLLHLLDTEVSTVLQAEAGRRVLVYTQMAYKEEIERWFVANKSVHQLAGVAFEHYWSGRGKDQYRHFETILCIGEPVPNLLGLVHEANALHPGGVEIAWSPESKKLRSDDPRLERVWNMLATQELSQALMRIRPGMTSTTEKRMHIFGNLVPLHIDFVRALHWHGTVSAKGEPKLQEGKLLPLSSEQVRDYILWVFKVTGCWCAPFLASLSKRGVANAPTAGSGEPIEDLLRPSPYLMAHSKWLREQGAVQRGVAMAEARLPPPDPLRTSWMTKLGHPVKVFGDVSRASQLLELLYKPEAS